ncbi:MAG: FAD-dependent oxidoreductase [Candidatus Bathyarchaeota archaeon]|nr:FAD-dependent oxidoreductase [Candidatus Bathyarchaeota archaeon]
MGKFFKATQVSGVLIAIGQSPNSYLVESLVDLSKKKEIVIATDCSTRTPGLFACGDVTSILDKRIIIASGEGAKAALSARRYLLKSKS